MFMFQGALLIHYPRVLVMSRKSCLVCHPKKFLPWRGMATSLEKTVPPGFIYRSGRIPSVTGFHSRKEKVIHSAQDKEDNWTLVFYIRVYKYACVHICFVR